MARYMCEHGHCTARCAAVMRAGSKLYREQAEATQCLEALPGDGTLLETFTTIGVHSEPLEAAWQACFCAPTMRIVQATSCFYWWIATAIGEAFSPPFPCQRHSLRIVQVLCAVRRARWKPEAAPASRSHALLQAVLLTPFMYIYARSALYKTDKACLQANYCYWLAGDEVSTSEQQDQGPPQNGALQRLQMLLQLVAAVCRVQQVRLPSSSARPRSGRHTCAAPLIAAVMVCVPMC